MRPSSELEELRAALRARSKPLCGRPAEHPADMLERVAAWCRARGVQFERYGSGELVEDFESLVAARLGYPAARFMPSGTMAQGIALRIWCARAKLHHFGMHPTSHLELHEERGHLHLHGLTATLVGPATRPMLAQDLDDVHEPIAALLTELPIREAGGQLPSWAELDALKQVARDRNVRLHLDGARLWETASFYQQPYEAICGGFDSCYVSFYKGIGALAGAMLLGDEDFIDEARVWQRRCGGTLHTFGTHVASAAMHFEERLALMPKLYQRTLEIAAILRSIGGMRVLPDPPHVNMMHVFLPVSAEAALARRDRVAEELGIWLFNTAHDADVPDSSRVELYMSDGALDLTDEGIRRGFESLLRGDP